MRLAIISYLIFFSFNCFSQNNNPDTSAFRKDFELLLKKYRIPSKGYSINVTSINQKGGQTALIITNNYLVDTLQRHLTESDLKNVLSKVKQINREYTNFDTTKVEIYCLPLIESQQLSVELKEKLEKLKYKVTTHYNLGGTKDLKENFDIMPGRENCVTIIVQPFRNKEL